MARVSKRDQTRLNARIPEHEGCNNCNGSGWKRGYSPKEFIGNVPLIQCTGPRPLGVHERLDLLERRIEELEKEREKRSR